MTFLELKINYSIKIFSLFLLLAVLVSLYISYLSYDAGKALITICVILFGLLYFFHKEKKAILQIIIIAFLIRAFFGIATSEFNIIPDFFGDPDLYHKKALIITEAFKHGNFITESDGRIFGSIESLSFAYFNSPFYIITGNSFLSMKVINSLFGALTAFLFYKIILNISNFKTAKMGFFLIAFFPSFILFSSQNFADSSIAFFTALFLYLSILFIKKQKIKYLIYALIPIAIGSLFRIPNAVIYILSLAPFFIFYLFKMKNNMEKPIIILFIIPIVVLFSIFLHKNLSNLTDITFLEEIRSYNTRGDSSYLQNLSYNSFTDIIKYTPIRSFYFAFSPLPWQINRPISYVASLESLLMFVFFILAIIYTIFSVKKINRRNEILFLWIFILIGISSYSIVESNVGSAIRHRIIFTPTIIVLMSYFLYNIKINIFKKY